MKRKISLPIDGNAAPFYIELISDIDSKRIVLWSRWTDCEKKKRRKIWRVCNKVLLLHPYSRAMLPGTLHFLCLIGVWCNGNTADSGPAFPGSSPGTPTNLFSSLLPG